MIADLDRSGVSWGNFQGQVGSMRKGAKTLSRRVHEATKGPSNGRAQWTLSCLAILLLNAYTLWQTPKSEYGCRMMYANVISFFGVGGRSCSKISGFYSRPCSSQQQRPQQRAPPRGSAPLQTSVTCQFLWTQPQGLHVETHDTYIYIFIHV